MRRSSDLIAISAPGRTTRILARALIATLVLLAITVVALTWSFFRVATRLDNAERKAADRLAQIEQARGELAGLAATVAAERAAVLRLERLALLFAQATGPDVPEGTRAAAQDELARLVAESRASSAASAGPPPASPDRRMERPRAASPPPSSTTTTAQPSGGDRPTTTTSTSTTLLPLPTLPTLPSLPIPIPISSSSTAVSWQALAAAVVLGAVLASAWVLSRRARMVRMPTRRPRRLIADARNRALRTFLVGLSIDVGVGVLVIIVAAFSKATAWDDFEWAVLSFSVGKTVVQSAGAYVLRRFVDRSSIPTPLPPEDPGHPADA